MKVVIINGSPRTSKFSNTDKIIQSFVKGLRNTNHDCEQYSLSARKEWDAAREAFLTNDNIIFALPMYVDSIPSLMLEFLDTLHPTSINPLSPQGCLPKQEHPTRLSFILHGGFSEGNQFRLCERLLKSITEQLGCTYNGCLIRGGSFMYRMENSDKAVQMTKPYVRMGESFGKHGTFLTPEAKKFTGPEYYPWLIRLLVRFLLKNVVNKKFDKVAPDWGCTTPLNIKHY